MTFISRTLAPASSVLAVLPGVALASMLAVLAFGLHAVRGFSLLSPMILSILLGMLFHNFIGTPAGAVAGVKFALRRVLRAAIVLLGLQLTAQQVIAVGWIGVVVIVATLVATFVVTKWVGRRLGVDPRLAELIAAGTSICGASAVIATNTVTCAHDEDVAYAIACVTVFGSIAMFLYPVLPGLLHLSPRDYGLWSGASIHEIAQVVAAAFQDGRSSGEFGTIAKLTRVGMLAPMVLVLGFIASRRQDHSQRTPSQRASMPWFVLGFVVLVIANSAVNIPENLRSLTQVTTTALLSLSLAAMGLETDFAKLRAKGLRPLALGAIAWAFIALFSLGLIECLA
ncbi:MAG: putative sulfate exporter family transporter [Alphaproteobacteria bacterium]|nr:putative sulfate exporter family transporter [Alphaproteobacteria bacterium]